MIRELEDLLEKAMKPGDLFSIEVSNGENKFGMNCLVTEIRRNVIHKELSVVFWTGKHEMILEGYQVLKLLGDGTMKIVPK